MLTVIYRPTSLGNHQKVYLKYSFYFTFSFLIKVIMFIGFQSDVENVQWLSIAGIILHVPNSLSQKVIEILSTFREWTVPSLFVVLYIEIVSHDRVRWAIFVILFSFFNFLLRFVSLILLSLGPYCELPLWHVYTFLTVLVGP